MSDSSSSEDLYSTYLTLSDDEKGDKKKFKLNLKFGNKKKANKANGDNKNSDDIKMSSDYETNSEDENMKKPKSDFKTTTKKKPADEAEDDKVTDSKKKKELEKKKSASKTEESDDTDDSPCSKKNAKQQSTASKFDSPKKTCKDEADKDKKKQSALKEIEDNKKDSQKTNTQTAIINENNKKMIPEKNSQTDKSTMKSKNDRKSIIEQKFEQTPAIPSKPNNLKKFDKTKRPPASKNHEKQSTTGTDKQTRNGSIKLNTKPSATGSKGHQQPHGSSENRTLRKNNTMRDKNGAKSSEIRQPSGLGKENKEKKSAIVSHDSTNTKKKPLGAHAEADHNDRKMKKGKGILSEIRNCKWYFGEISGKEAEKLLEKCGGNALLIRKRVDKSEYFVSLKLNKKYQHILIHFSSDGINFEEKKFQNIESFLSKFVSHYAVNENNQKLEVDYVVNSSHSLENYSSD